MNRNNFLGISAMKEWDDTQEGMPFINLLSASHFYALGMILIDFTKSGQENVDLSLLI